MKKTVSVAVLIVAVTAAYWIVQAGSLEPPGPPAPTMVPLDQLDAKLSAIAGGRVPHQFVEVTTTPLAGSGGWRQLSQVCQDEFSATYASIRMCTSEEILNTPIPWQVPATFVAWVHPVYVPIGSSWGADVSGVIGDTTANLSCNGWSSGSASGLVLTGDGAFSQGACNQSFRIACCAPPGEIP